MLADLFKTIDDDCSTVQLAMLTAVVKMFIKQPRVGEKLLPLILEWATETCGDPDIRDRMDCFLIARWFYLLEAVIV